MVYSERRRRDVFIEAAVEATTSTQFVESGRYYLPISKNRVVAENYLKLIHEDLPVLKNGWRIEMGEKKSDEFMYTVYFVVHKKNK
jgi:hypothetical protein